MADISQHNVEIAENLESWNRKPLLRRIYEDFYERIAAQIDPQIEGHILELGSGVGNLKTAFPDAIASDLFPNPWLDLICDGYELPFDDGALSHLILFDVFHHLEAPAAFLREAKRALAPGGRVIVFDPYVSLSTHWIYGWLHHEPSGWRENINSATDFPPPRDYYAAQGNATRIFFFGEALQDELGDWNMLRAERFAAFSYIFSGGFSRPACYPPSMYPLFKAMDGLLSKCPTLFGGRCLVTLEKVSNCQDSQSLSKSLS